MSVLTTGRLETARTWLGVGVGSRRTMYHLLVPGSKATNNFSGKLRVSSNYDTSLFDGTSQFRGDYRSTFSLFCGSSLFCGCGGS